MLTAVVFITLIIVTLVSASFTIYDLLRINSIMNDMAEKQFNNFEKIK